MELTKSKYKKNEVLEIISKETEQLNNEISEDKLKIFELVSEIKSLKLENSKLKEKESLIGNSIEQAEESAEKMKAKADKQYNLELQTLKRFNALWKGYFNYLLETYPMYPQIKEMRDIVEKINVTVKNKNLKENVKDISKDLEKVTKKGVFNPKERVESYLNTTSDNGFNMDEVLNPGDIKLEDICKELGLIEED